MFYWKGAVVKGDRNFHVIRQLNSGQNLEMINPKNGLWFVRLALSRGIIFLVQTGHM